MPTLEIQGIGKIEVGPEFFRLSPQDRDKAIDEIAASAQELAPAPDPREVEARAMADQIEAAGGEAGAGTLFQNAFSLGLQDKVAGLAGGVGSMVQGDGFGKGYKVSSRAQQILEDRARERTGGYGTAAEVFGALSTGAVAKAPAAASWLGRAFQAGKEGALLGAGQGVGDSVGGVGEAASGAAKGGALGVGLGGTLSAGTDLVIGIGRGMRGGARAAEKMMEDPSRRAARMASEALNADDMSPAQVAARMRRSQADQFAPNLTLMDVADENVRGLAASAAANPGRSKRAVSSYLNRRAAGQGERVLNAGADALGDPNAFRETGQEIAKRRGDMGDRMYGAAFSGASPVDGIDDIVMELDGRLVSAKGGVHSTLKKVRDVLISKQTMGEFPDRDLRSLHEAKLAIDNLLSSQGDGSMGKVARAEVAKYRRKLLEAMDRSNPAYGAARSKYADESALLDAMESGRRFLKEDVDELPDMLASMGSAEKQMFQQGVIREIRQMVENAPDGADVVKRVFGSKAKRSALRSAFSDDASFRKFQATMMREAAARQTQDVVGVRRGSRTEVLRAEREAASGFNEVVQAGSDIAIDVATTGGVGTVNRTLQAATKMLRARTGMDPDVAEQVAKIMMEENPNEVLKMLANAGNTKPFGQLSNAARTRIKQAIPVGGSVAIQKSMHPAPR